MKVTRLLLILFGCTLLTSLFSLTSSFSGSAGSGSSSALGNGPEPANSSWYFAVSGDSRDCGDLIMPKIANSVAVKRKQMPLKFYWHLGDFRALYRIDCDMAKRMDPPKKCALESSMNELNPTDEYLKAAWPDFISNEVKPFELAGIPIYLGIGNHETIGRKPEDFRSTFKKWLTLPAITSQRKKDRKKQILSEDGGTYFHFVMKGADFIYLDNANAQVGFSNEQLNWLALILKADASNNSVKTIIVGMHAALPGSVSSNHAMDESCPATCSGLKAYALLEQAQNLAGSKRKNVYVLASHSHFFEENIYNTPQHQGHVLPGWIIGTAGAEQYKPTIRYGYMLVEIKSDGTVGTSFVDVDRNSPPTISGDAGEKLTNYCFQLNKKPPISQAAQNCHCNAP